MSSKPDVELRDKEEVAKYIQIEYEVPLLLLHKTKKSLTYLNCDQQVIRPEIFEHRVESGNYFVKPAKFDDSKISVYHYDTYEGATLVAESINTVSVLNQLMERIEIIEEELDESVVVAKGDIGE